MLLLSKKVYKSANNDEDFISKLPEMLLIQILSLLPEADANRTCILSKRWKNIWAFLPNLRFVTPSINSIQEINRFQESLDQTLTLRGGMPIHRFLLCCSQNFDSHHVYDCLRRVITECKVQELQLRVSNTFWFGSDLIKACSGLVSFTLSGDFDIHKHDLRLVFPCLKKIVLESDYPLGIKSIENLISRCPVLEELSVESKLIGQIVDTDKFIFSSPSLKRLRLSYVIMVYEVLIDAPKLEFLDMWDYKSESLTIWDVSLTSFSQRTPLSLMEVHINTRHESVGQLITCLSPVKILTLAGSTLESLLGDATRGLFRSPVFSNLVKFVVGFSVIWDWIILPDLLDSMPNLEHITFADGLIPFPCDQRTFRVEWDQEEDVPACFRFKVKEIIIKNQETITTEEFDLIKCLLKHSYNLETLTMNAHNIEEEKREQLLNFHRGSEFCRIQFL